MLILAIESATERVGCALGDGETVRAVFEITGERRHAERLVPAIDALCRAAGVTFDDVGCIAADVGPGLFTGLRVGLATARALAHALDVPVVGVSSLELLAHPLRLAGRMVASVIDARRGEVYWQLFRPEGDHLHSLGPARCAPPDELLGELRTTDEAMVLVGDGARRYRDRLADLSDAVWADADLAHPSASSLVVLAQVARLAGAGGEAADLEPMYLRAPDAQINWATRALSASDGAGAGR